MSSNTRSTECYFLGDATTPAYTKALAELTRDVKRANKKAATDPSYAGFTHHVRIVNYKTGKTGLYWREAIV